MMMTKLTTPLASIIISAAILTTTSSFFFAPPSPPQIKKSLSNSRRLQQKTPETQHLFLTKSTTASSSSSEQAEQYLSEYYPQFYYYVLQQNPVALQLLRNSKAGFAIFAPSDSCIASYLGFHSDDAYSAANDLLEAACTNEEMQPVLAKIASYHVVSGPMTTEILEKYGVVSTPGGELSVSSSFVKGEEEATRAMLTFENGVNILSSCEFQNELIENVQDIHGNIVASNVIEGGIGGKKCIVHEVNGFVAPENLWGVLFDYFGMGSGSSHSGSAVVY